MKFEELEQKTDQWGRDRLITVNGNVLTQTVKFGEEMGEYFEPSGGKDEVVDAIGDMMVVLTMITGLMDIYPSELLLIHSDIATNFDLDAEQDFVALYGELCSAAVRDDNIRLQKAIVKLILGLKWLAFYNTTDLAACWTVAYNEIKDRKGKLLENGNFVKDEDSN